MVGCDDGTTSDTLVPDEIKVLKLVPSGSGIAIIDSIAYIIGDDATGVYQLNLRNYSHHKIPIHGFPGNQDREPKPTKHDFESAAVFSWSGNEYLLAFGSGSTLPARDSLLILNLGDFEDQKIIPIRNFYRKLMEITKTDSMHWNIEGAAIVNDHVFLCNRGNNLLIKFTSAEFANYLFTPGSPFPAIEFYRIKLPSIQGKEARLSGACTLDTGTILFSASVEDVQDWTQDGPILGSFIGTYSTKEKIVRDYYLLQDSGGKALKEKIESIDLLKYADSSIGLIGIGDNDDGSSKLFRFKLGSASN